MLDFLATNWGSLISALGFAATIVIAWSARSASRSASEAASATRDDIGRYLQTVDLYRAIGLIQLIKTQHDHRRWEAAREHYQELRAMLSDIIARCPERQADFRERLATSRTLIMTMENSVGQYITRRIAEHSMYELNEELNDIQFELEKLASEMGLGDEQREAQ